MKINKKITKAKNWELQKLGGPSSLTYMNLNLGFSTTTILTSSAVQEESDTISVQNFIRRGMTILALVD